MAKTSFKPVDLKVDFPAMEKELITHWYSSGIVDKYLHKNDASEKRFSFIDGPITANNYMGVHHGWGRTYKDLWQRYKNMQGYKERFQNGFDCQGLWVEVEVEKELDVHNKRDIENLVPGDKKASIAKFVQLCKDRVTKFSGIQTEQTKRLGNFMDWDHSYFTMSDENNYMIWDFLKTCHEKGWMYQGPDSVPWCPRCQTAISQHEMLTEDYKELTHETVFVRLPIVSEGWEDTSLLVWTTTPWTVPANVGVGVNVKFTYGVWKEASTGKKTIIIYKNELGEEVDRVHKNMTLPVAGYIFGHEAIHNGEYTLEKEISGKDLLGLRYVAPFDFLPIVKEAQAKNPEKFHTVLDGSDIVTSQEGTGLLHVATGCGKEDFDLGKKERLPIISPIDDEANYVEGMNEFSGQNGKKHPEIILDYLRNLDGGKYILKTLQYTHRYPACWRCKTELVWKVAQEWYIAMDVVEKNGDKTLRQQMVDTANMIEWHPSFGLDRELDWLKNMHDWLISKKNRYWGLALPIYECTECKTFEVIGSKKELQEKAVEGWNEFEGHTPHKPYIDEVKIACPTCQKPLSRIDDVGNVWLDAGIVPFSTMVDPKTGELSYTTDKEYWKEWFPADFITESFPGQFKNWFYSMIAMSTVLEKRNPFKTILGYASVLAEDGRPMHKSWGNSIEFNEGADKIGVDVMRWLYARNDPEQNLLFGYKKGDEVRRQFHLMLWNIYNFFVLNANTDGWDPDQKVESKNVLDEWILARLNEVIEKTTNALDTYQADKATEAIEGFVEDLSTWYIRRSRDRVGPSAENVEDKNAFYQATYIVLTTLSKLLAPFMPFMSEAIYTNLTGEESVHLADWPQLSEEFKVKSEEEKKNIISGMSNLRNLVIEHLQRMRKESGIKVRQPLRRVIILDNEAGGYKKSYQQYEQLIKDELNVKDVEYDLWKNLTPEQQEELKGQTTFYLDTHLTPELKAEGEARDIVRQIQEERKKLGTLMDEMVDVSIENIPAGFEEYIKKQALVRTLSQGTFSVTR
jgi:isoleucyl-tRNA synthetase